MRYRVLANLVLALHLIFTFLALFGVLGIFISSWWLLIHLPVVMWSVAVNVGGWTCPLTPLEKRLRKSAGLAEYQGSFTEKYILPAACLRLGPRNIEILTGVIILVWNIALYAIIWRML